MAFLILLTIFLSGSILFKPFKGLVKTINPIPYFFLYGSVFTIPLLYIISSHITHGLFWGIAVWIALLALIYFFSYKRIHFTHVSRKNIIQFLTLSFLCFLVLSKTFQYVNSTFLIASNLYADMGVHIPVIKSFSQGNNFPFELPFFGGKNLTYHFFYDFFTGVLEFSGLRIDFAYNLIFAFSLVSLFFLCIDFGANVFKKKLIGLVAFFLFVFPPDFSFVNIILTNKENLLKGLWSNNMYNLNSFLGDHTIGNFLYFNTYLNQRHLFFALVLSLAIVIPLWNMLANSSGKKWNLVPIILGMFIGLATLWNVPVSFILIYFFVILSLVFKLRLKAFFTTLIIIFLSVSLPLFLIGSNSKNQIQFEPGFLIHDSFSFVNISYFWILNLGFAIIAMLGGFVLSGKKLKILFIILLPIFLIPNILQITRHMFDNHKFFNFWFLYMCFFSASFTIFLLGRRRFVKAVGICFFLLMTVSGILNSLVIKNDVLTPIPDYKYYPLVKKLQLISKDHETVITNGEIYDPVSVAGRKTYLGRLNDIYSFGGNPQERVYALNDLLENYKTEKLVRLAKVQGIKYIIIYKDKNVKNLKPIDLKSLDREFKKIYEDNFGVIYKI